MGDRGRGDLPEQGLRQGQGLSHRMTRTRRTVCGLHDEYSTLTWRLRAVDVHGSNAADTSGRSMFTVENGASQVGDKVIGVHVFEIARTVGHTLVTLSCVLSRLNSTPKILKPYGKLKIK